MKRSFCALASVFIGSSAMAGDHGPTRIGFGISGWRVVPSGDLAPDLAVSNAGGTGLVAHVPVRIPLSPLATLRLEARGGWGIGGGNIELGLDPDLVCTTDDDCGPFSGRSQTIPLHAMIGPEIHVPASGFDPYFAAAIGAGWTQSMFSLRWDRGADDAVDLESDGPGYFQEVDEAGVGWLNLLADAYIGVATKPESGARIWFEAGYSGSFLPSRDLAGDYSAGRVRFDPIRAGVGVDFPL